MPVCCNYDCDNPIIRKGKIRCAKCRHNEDYRCSICGVDLGFRPGKIECDDCNFMKNREHRLGLYKRNNDKIRLRRKKHWICKCGKPIPKYQAKWCSEKCRTFHRFKNKRQINECVMCDNSLVNTRRQKTCSEDCASLLKTCWKLYYKKKRECVTPNL